MARRTGHPAAVATLLLLAVAGTLPGQSVVDRTPNLDDGWTVAPGVVQFNFLHRFEVSPPPARKVTSFPNFHLATGIPLALDVQLDYATNSTVFTGIPNEYQLGLRRPLLRQSRGRPLDVTITGGYNFASQSVDGELGLARWMGPVRLLGTVRGISDGYDVQRSLWGVGTGVVVRLTSWLSLAGDVFDLVDAPDRSLAPAWGAAAQLPHPLQSPQLLDPGSTNTQSGSIEGASRGVRGAHMAGFEFTIPFTLSRYFGRRGKPAPPAAGVPAATVDSARGVPADSTRAAGSATVSIVNLSFGTRELRCGPGPACAG